MSVRFKQTWIALATAASVSVSGCASTSAKPTFRDLTALIEARTGRKISWNQGGEDDLAVAKKVETLLAKELLVDGAVQIALLNNKGLQATYEDLSIAQADLVQAGLLANPVFGAGLVVPVAGKARAGVTLSVSLDFMSVFVLAARKKVAEAELRAVKLRVGDAVLRVTYDVQAAFYALSAAQQIVAMRKTILETGDAAVDLARRQHEAGNINDLELANQESLYEQVRIDLVRSQADVIVARESLTRLMGLWGAHSVYDVAHKLPELPAAEVDLTHLESLAIGRRFDLGAAHETAQAFSHALALAKNFRWLGSTSVAGSYDRTSEGYSVAGPSVALELPIFDQKQAVIARLEAQLRAALARETALAIDIRSEVRSVRGRVEATRTVVERYAKVVVPLRQRVVALSQEQYNAMLIGAFQLLQAKQNEVNTYREFIDALREYWIARADLERTTAGLIPMPTKPSEKPTVSAPTPASALAPGGSKP